MLTAARTAFAERGFDGATIRAIAATAGVDPALVHHYFGTKRRLFLAAVTAPADPDEELTEVLSVGRAELGHAIVRAALRAWDGPNRLAGLAMLRSALDGEPGAGLLREFLLSQAVRRVVATLDCSAEESAARGALLASQLVGLIVARHVLRFEPLASASAESIVAAVGPTVQRYLTGEVELPDRR